MQYSVKGSDGNQYGPVDLMTLKQWVTEGRVLPNSLVTDNLSNVSLLASQMPELGMATHSAPYANTPAPPQSFGEYPRPGMVAPSANQPTKLWSILIWLGIAVVLSMFTRYGGVIISGWNIIDAAGAKARNDPKSGLCFGFAIGGFLLILLWTYIKYQAVR
jgi:hypothetical protein